MMVSKWLSISMISIILLCTKIGASKDRYARQTRVDLCPLSPGTLACGFVNCTENGGVCVENRTIADCFTCRCPVGFTGKMCDTSITITPGGCNPICLNGGVCQGNICSCPAGFIGGSCETKDSCLPSNPCQNGGRCTSTGTTYVCDCTNTGYTGSTCTVSVVTDPCVSRPCQNNGQCSSNNGVVSCSCVNGFTGASCQIAPIPCGQVPCLNGGKCDLVAGNTFACTCLAAFTGRQCETFIQSTHPCVTMANTICQNSGTCTANGAAYVCQCATGWTGTNCEIRVATSSCTPNPCGAHGTCESAILPSGPIALCSCQDRWTGKYCDVNMDAVCTTTYCENGGTCRLNGNTPSCTCPPTHTGQRCETLTGSVTTTTTMTTTTTLTMTTTPILQISCAAQPCQNGATCFKNGNSFFCACQPQWTGVFCQIYSGSSVSTTTTTSPSIIGCSPNPCFNGASCFKNGNSFVCVCTSQYSGPTCATPKITTTPTATVPGSTIKCVNQPCLNGGTCYNTGNTYFCYCTANYSGKSCELNTSTSPANCPLNCTPGTCVATGNAQSPYACMCNGILNPVSCQ